MISYVPKLVLRRMFQNNQAIKAPEIETFPAAVVFADISGFTPLTEKLAAQGAEGIERLTTELNKYFGRFVLLQASTHRTGSSNSFIFMEVTSSKYVSMDPCNLWIPG